MGRRVAVAVVPVEVDLARFLAVLMVDVCSPGIP